MKIKFIDYIGRERYFNGKMHVKFKLKVLPKSYLCRDLAGINPREVIEHDSDPANLLIHGLARKQNLNIFIILKLSHKDRIIVCEFA